MQSHFCPEYPFLQEQSPLELHDMEADPDSSQSQAEKFSFSYLFYLFVYWGSEEISNSTFKFFLQNQNMKL